MLLTKKYHRLEEVASRRNCAVDDLLYWAEEGKLAIALPPEPITDRFYYITNPRDFSKTLSGTNESDVVLVAHTPEQARGLFTDSDGNIFSEEALEAMSEAEFKEVERRLYQRQKFPPGYLEHRRFTTDNLLITHEELERIERENGINDNLLSVSDATLCRNRREQLRHDDLNRQWELLNGKLSKLKEQLISETRSEEKFRLEKLVYDTKIQCDQIEEQLKGIENQLAKVSSDAKEGTGRNDDQDL